jgi:PAS domain S-box-containing protein
MTDFENGWFDEYFDAIRQYMWILDARGNVIKANQAVQELTGLTHAAMIGTPLWSVPWSGLSRQNRWTLKWVAREARMGRAASHEIEIRRRGQPGMVIDLSLKPVMFEEGSIKFIIAEGHDITAYKRTSEALNQSEARFKTIFDKAGIGILIKDVNGKMLDCNPAFQSMLGYTTKDLSRLDYLDITHSLDKKASQKLFNELVNDKRKSYFIEKRYIHKDGQLVWARITASLVFEQDHQAQFVIALVENITAQKEIETELTELQQRLMQGREMERLRLAQELHDGPLQEVIGVTYQIQGLEDMILENPVREQLQAIHIALNKLSRSLRTICGELRPPALAPFGLEKTIRSHADQFQADHPELTVQSDLDHDGQALSEQVRIVLFRIYQEALNNIVRHAQASTVQIRFKLEDEQAILEIQDDGKGFELPNRWIKLARTGHLGIVGAMERAKEVGGNLEITTSPGRGATIRAVVPRNEERFRLSSQEDKT